MQKSKHSLIAIGLLVCLFLGWWLLHSDPREAFLAEVEDMLGEVNNYQHGQIRERLAPEAADYIEQNYMSVQQALITAQRIDSSGGHQYRVHNLAVFYPDDYAEVEFERSAPNGTFTGENIFPIPFIHIKGKWWIAGGFRTERNFESPY